MRLFKSIALILSSPLVESGMIDGPSLDSSDVAPLLRIHYQTNVFIRAQDYLDSLRAKPLCHQIAAADLIKSCEELGQESEKEISREFEQIREAAKTEYTVRLALCEMNDARVEISQDCTPFLPSAEACEYRNRFGFRKWQSPHDSSLCYPKTQQRDLQQCLVALWTSPQSWTSYSNAQQNAIVVCQATHEAIEKDRIIELLTSAVEVNGQLTAANEDAIQRQQNAQKAFDEALQSFGSALQSQIRDLESQGGSIVANLFDAASNAISEIYRGTREAVKTTDNLNEALSTGRTTAASLKLAMEELRRHNKDSRDELISTHSSQLETAHLSFDQVMLVVRRFMSEELATLEARLADMTTASQQAATTLTNFELGLSRSQEMLEEHNVRAQKVYGAIERLMIACSGYNIFLGIGALLGLVGAHMLLRFILGTEAAAKFVCVFAAMSATHIFGPAHLVPISDRFKWTNYAWSPPSLLAEWRLTIRTIGVLCTCAVIAGILRKCFRNHKRRYPLPPTLPITTTTLYNPASPPYSLPSWEI